MIKNHTPTDAAFQELLSREPEPLQRPPLRPADVIEATVAALATLFRCDCAEARAWLRGQIVAEFGE